MKLRRFVSACLLSLLLAGLIGTLLPANFNVKKVQAAPDTLPSDGDAWTENDNATYPWTVNPSYPDTIEFTTEKAYVGSYSLKINHTSAATGMAFQLDFGTTDLSNYSAVSFYVYLDADRFSTPQYLQLRLAASSFGTAHFRIGNLYGFDNVTWARAVFPFNAFIQSGTNSWTNRRYFYVYINGLTANDYTTIYFDGIYFLNWTNDVSVSITNDDDIKYLSNLYAPFPSYAEKYPTIYQNDSYTSTFAFLNKTTGAYSVENSELEAEQLGEEIWLNAMAYNLTKSPTYLANLNKFVDWTLILQNDTYNCVVRRYYNGTDTFQDEAKIIDNGWMLTGLSYAYEITGNETFKTFAEGIKTWLCDTMWNSANNVFDDSFVPSTGGKTTQTGYSAQKDAWGISGLAVYYRFISANSTVLDICEKCLNKRYGGSYSQTMFEWGDYESASYTHWAGYHLYKATSNSTYLDWAHYQTEINLAQYLIYGNSSQPHKLMPFSSDQTDTIDSGGMAVQYLLQLFLYEEDAKWHTKDLMRKMIFDEISQQLSSLYMHSRYYPNTDAAYMWAIASASLFEHVALLKYFFDINPETAPFAYLTTGEITAHSYASQKLTLTINGSGTTTTEVYCGSKGEPTTVTGANSWSYNSTTKICIITVTHSSLKTIEISWLDSPPTLGAQGYNTTTAGALCNFYSKWEDDKGLSHCVFGTNVTGSWQNETHTLTSNSDWCNVTKILPSQGGIRVEYQFWANDSADQWTTSNLQWLTTTAAGAPTYSNIGYNTTLAENATEFSCYWQDVDGLSHFIFTWNGTGSWTNDTASSLTGTADWANVTKTLPSNVGVVVGFRLYCNDTGDNWGDTGIQTLTTTETTVWYCFRFNFKDLDNNDVESKITWRLYNNSQALSYTEGEATLLSGTYTLKTYYHSKLMNQTSLTTETYGNTTVNMCLMMKKYAHGYVAFNNTITSITINSQTSNKLTFTVEGSSPQMIIVDVLQNASSIQRNGVKQTNWTYNDTSKYIQINAVALSIWEITFEEPGKPYFTEALILGTVLAVASGAILAFIYRRKKKRSASVP